MGSSVLGSHFSNLKRRAGAVAGRGTLATVGPCRQHFDDASWCARSSLRPRPVALRCGHGRGLRGAQSDATVDDGLGVRS